MAPPTPVVRRGAGQRVSTLTEPQVANYRSTGRPIRIDDLHWKQTLTLNLHINQMNVQSATQRHGAYNLGQIQDEENRWFPVRNWRPSEWTSFVAEFERVTEGFWSRRFMLIPPSSYDGLDWPQRRSTHRPNVITHLDVNIRAQTGRRHYGYEIGWYPVSIWKLATRLDLPGGGIRLPMEIAAAAVNIGRRFRSASHMMVREDAFVRRGRTAIHEVGHLTMQRHPGLWRHVRVPGCHEEPNRHACYVGTRPEHEDNIMGLRRGLLPQNVDPWRSFVAEATSTREDDWGVYMMDSREPMPQPRELTP